MFAYIQGKLTQKEPTNVIVDVNGLGYELRISLHTYDYLQDKESIKLLTYLHIKEDAHTLYGFAEDNEKKLFLDLIGISGVGPNTALVMLSSLSVSNLKAAISTGDIKTIQSIKGIGAKTAQRIVLELQDKTRKEETSDGKVTGLPFGTYNTLRTEALTALVTLGMSKAVAEKSIDKVLSDWQKRKDLKPIMLEDLIKTALKTA